MMYIFGKTASNYDCASSLMTSFLWWTKAFFG